MMFYSYLDSPIGTLLIAGGSEAIRHIQFPKRGKTGEPGQPRRPEAAWQESARAAVGEAVRQLREYFRGRRTEFDLPLELEGTLFQRAVWRGLQEIPYGQTISYGELARRIGNPKASRAVGAANHCNPIPIVIPCHRVIGSNGKMVGFGGGVPVKEALLELETATLAASRPGSEGLAFAGLASVGNRAVAGR